MLYIICFEQRIKPFRFPSRPPASLRRLLHFVVAVKSAELQVLHSIHIQNKK